MDEADKVDFFGSSRKVRERNRKKPDKEQVKNQYDLSNLRVRSNEIGCKLKCIRISCSLCPSTIFFLANLDFVDEAKKRFAVVPILTDHVSPVLHIVLHCLCAVQLLFQFFQLRRLIAL